MTRRRVLVGVCALAFLTSCEPARFNLLVGVAREGGNLVALASPCDGEAVEIVQLSEVVGEEEQSLWRIRATSRRNGAPVTAIIGGEPPAGFTMEESAVKTLSAESEFAVDVWWWKATGEDIPDQGMFFSIDDVPLTGVLTSEGKAISLDEFEEQARTVCGA